MTWHLQQIPKIAHFYWGNETLSYLRYLTLWSFKKYNPDWKVKLYRPKISYRGQNTWSTWEHPGRFIGNNHLEDLMELDIEKITVDFSGMGFDDNLPEPFKADFLRWKLLSSEGGLWSDFDIIYFKPMECLYFNHDFNESVDTVVCINEHGIHAIGFLLSSASNPYYGYISGKLHSHLNPADYESIGSSLLNAHFPQVSGSLGLNFVNLKMEVVYTLRDYTIPSIFKNGGLSSITPDTIGMHWYAGHPESIHWENTITEQNYKDYDNILCKVIEKAVREGNFAPQSF